MKKPKILLLLTFFAGAMGLSNIASACCSSNTGLVTSILQLPTGQFFFALGGTESGKPACNTANRYVIDASTAIGRNSMAVILMTYSNQTSMTVVGLKTCTGWADTEDVGYIQTP